MKTKRDHLFNLVSYSFFLSSYTAIREYRYWDADNKSLDFAGLIEDLLNAPEKSLVVLHACAHNPPGVDPTREQWEEIALVIRKRRLFPLFDSAYQGFASGDPGQDAWAVRRFVQLGFELFCAQSFAKNFGLYDERAGNLTIVVSNANALVNMKSHLALLVRGNYSTPPAHGARIVSRVLNDPQLNERWLGHIREMSTRILAMRAQLRAKLEELGTPGSWSHITSQIGMFSYTGLNGKLQINQFHHLKIYLFHFLGTEKQSAHLVQKFHMYLPKSGRVSICGINSHNVDDIAKAIEETVRSVQ